MHGCCCCCSGHETLAMSKYLQVQFRWCSGNVSCLQSCLTGPWKEGWGHVCGFVWQSWGIEQKDEESAPMMYRSQPFNPLLPPYLCYSPHWLSSSPPQWPSSLFNSLLSSLFFLFKVCGFHEIDGAIGRCHGDAGTLILILILYFTFFPPSSPSLFFFFLSLPHFTLNLPYKTLHTLKFQYLLCHLAYWVLWKAWTDVVLTIMFVPPLLHCLFQFMT